MVTVDNNYIPTEAEQKLLTALANPENYKKSVTALCNAAGVSRLAYYRAMKNTAFVKFYHKAMMDMLSGEVGEIIKASIKFGTKNPQNHQDRKMLLEMVGLYTPKQELKHSGEISVRKLEDFF